MSRERRRLERLAETRRRQDVLRKGEKAITQLEEGMLRELQDIERQLRAGGMAQRAWEDHELNWQAHTGELRGSIIQKSAHIMLAFEDMQRADPAKFDGDAKVKELLHWWLEKGGREDYLSRITLEERRELERMAEEWKKKNL